MWILPKSLISAFAPGTAALTSDSKAASEACAQSLMRRSKSSQSKIFLREWKAGNWTRLRSGLISSHSLGSNFTDWWTSSLAATRANLSAQQASGLEKRILGTSGLGLRTGSAFSDPESASLRTSKDISLWGCATSSTTWQEWVIERRGAYSARAKSAHHTSENGSLSWPTVQSCEAKSDTLQDRKARGKQVMLCHAVRQWPTPDTCSRGDGPSQLDRNTPTLQTEVKQWATPSSREHKGHTITDKFQNGFNITLSNQIMQHGLPDPASSNTHGSLRGLWQTATVSTGAHRQKDGSMINKLDQQVKQSFGKLNPRWVETLMGLPVGWTMPSCACPATIERMNSDC